MTCSNLARTGRKGVAREIERKFMVQGDERRQGSKGVYCCQGYLVSDMNCTVRVRIMGERAFLTIKGKTKRISRLEYEHTIPATDAREMLEYLCLSPLIEKYRHTVIHAG